MVEEGGEGEAGPSRFDGGKLLVQHHCNVEAPRAGLFETICFSRGYQNCSYALTFPVSVPGDWLTSYRPVSIVMGHPDKAEDKNPCLTPCANTLTYPCLADFTGRLFNHDFLVPDYSSIIPLHDFQCAMMEILNTAKARWLCLFAPEPSAEAV